MTLARRSGLLIILSSPSGAGKTTLSRRLLADDAAISFSISATTRKPRPGELDGREYFFKTPEQFQDMVSRGEMLEHAEVFGNFYGTPKGPVEQAVTQGQDVIFDVDWQGGQQIRRSPLGHLTVSIFLLPPSIAELEDRLEKRGQDSAEVVAARMAKSRDEISHWEEYDYVLVNENLDVCEQQLRSILAAERLRKDRQIHLVNFVKELNKEFEDMS
jgi:guanylate kinase